ncbi:Gfo/Idh/MocA family protein [Chelatococcus asaccharovorans]|uniref:Myo-inositol 2-dehydrogenase/D-chiro-inositol 1-dehydrogenase n=1 Tax=Chelatococcus asaccharovorans TaxID=28210 RepID=A0A2V3TVP9_9HYPH|nr:Gfo/Idh/MocA family oxidoreductase [Chelatococcus asaccharovorans]MBS7702119.1 Gfo/Idh/MocA family oxidoreductase [Chelatococcus asaccharovorans]PXW52888.1 myo-inositol 2-dehydrogenase/D-chiro-inositol 1-dehydrogenase [Chelatococcus asaccharovorans]
MPDAVSSPQAMSGSRSRVALAGFGAWGQMHARALAAIPEAELVAIYCHGDTSAAAAAALAPGVPVFRRYDDVLALDALDVVNIAVPNDRHAAFAMAALKAGHHVFLEKPLGLSLDECDAVLAAAHAAGRMVAVNHELRVSHQWGEVRETIAAGDIGQVTHQHFSLFRHAFRPGSGGWRRDPARVGSWILEELVHFVDLVLWYARENGPPVRLLAQSTSPSGLSDTVSVLMTWADGSTALVTQCLAGFQHHTLLEIAGTAGALRTWWAGAYDRTAHPSFALDVQRRGASEVETIAIPQSGEIFELEENMRRALRGFHTGDLVMPAHDARAAVGLCLAIEQSIREGGAVELSGYI